MFLASFLFFSFSFLVGRLAIPCICGPNLFGVCCYLLLMKHLRFRSAMLTPPFTAAPGTVYLFALFSFKSMILSPSSFQAAAVFKKHRFFLVSLGKLRVWTVSPWTLPY